MPERVSVRLCFHDRCFDGAASSAVFTRFYRERIHAGADFRLTGMTHRAVQPFTDGICSTAMKMPSSISSIPARPA